MSQPAYQQYRLPPEVTDRASAHPLFQGLMPLQSGFFSHAAGHTMSRDSFGEYLLIWCVAGKGAYVSAGHAGTLHAGQALFLSPGTGHSYSADGLTPWTIHWVHFAGTLAPVWMTQLSVTPSSPCISTGLDSSLPDAFLRLHRHMVAGTLDAEYLMACSALHTLMSAMAASPLCLPAGKADSVPVSDILAFMRQNLDQPLNLEALAGHFHMSRFHFSRLFKARTGLSPMDCLLQMRMQRACAILQTEPLTVTAVARMTGFPNPYHFSATFHKVMGMSPTDFRARGRI